MTAIIVTGDVKEIAALALAVQERQRKEARLELDGKVIAQTIAKAMNRSGKERHSLKEIIADEDAISELSNAVVREINRKTRESGTPVLLM